MNSDKINFIEGNKFFEFGKILFTTDANIEKFIRLGNNIIVLVKTDEFPSDRNIFCYDKSGRLKWQIPQPDVLISQNYYTSIYLSTNNELKAYNWNGVEVTIDVETGKIVQKALIK